MSKTRYKMYKKGKHWIITGIVSGAVVLGVGNVTAQADTGASADVGLSVVDDESGSGEPTDKVVLTTPTGSSMEESAAGEAIGVPDESAEPEVTTDASEAPTPVIDQKASGEGSTVNAVPQKSPDNVADVTMSKTPSVPRVTSEVPSASDVPEVTMPETQPAVPDTSTKVHAEPVLAAVPLVKKQVAKMSAPVVTPAPATTNIDQWMPNKTLQKVILLTLQEVEGTDKTWNSVADITQDDLALLTTLDVKDGKGYDTYIDGKTPFSVEGLQYAKNLWWLSMGGSLNIEPGAVFGDIVDVTPLANLQKLTHLDLQGNKITDISPLANLKNLDGLYLAYNHIRDFSPLKGFKGDMNSLGQFIILDPLLVSDKDRTGHMQIQCITIDGEVVQLTAKGGLVEPVFANPEKDNPDYHFYYTKGESKSDGKGGIYFSGLRDQQPGPTASPIPGLNAIALPDAFYLTGQGEGFNVVQPYIIADDAANVIVHYQDKNGGKLADDKVLSGGLVGEDYKTTPADIPGYKLTDQSANTTGKYSKDKIDVTYVYTKIAGLVTAHYQDKDGHQLAADKVLPGGLVGEDYKTTPVDVPGYKLTDQSANATGKLGENDIVVTYTYTQIAGSVTVHYQDKDGHQLAADKVLPAGLVGADYATTPVDVPGYKLTDQSANATGKLGDKDIVVTYTYTQIAGSVTAHYQDKDGHQLAADKVLPAGLVGADYTTTPIDVPGYTLMGHPDNASGKYSAIPVTVTYVYAKDEVKPPVAPPAKQTTVTVHHRTVDGKTVAPDAVQSGKVGTAYVTHAANPAGYKLKITPENATGTFGEKDFEITYFYAPVETGGGETPGPGNPGGSGEKPEPGNPGDGNTGGSEKPNPGNPGGGEKPTPGTPGGGNNGGGQTPGPSNPDTGNHGNGNEIPGTSQPGPGTDNPGQTPGSNGSNPAPDTSTEGAGDGADLTTPPSKPAVAPTSTVSATSPATINLATPNRPTSTKPKPQTASMLPQTGEKPTQLSVWGFICLSVTWGVLGLLGVKRKIR
ncbi:MucBP domain-containing protein [Levilactobacillus andaensis]|uniref:MucBP domain-containing protein n=1 Tax=Levilactobacillus andaensis TaxID=2799570 RepID=UPI0019418AA3|nr:MucBP domain-containing protein [Levilactobacillus andaensis]